MAQNQTLQRRRFRFSLRTLLALVMVACVAFGWIGYKVRQGEQQRKIVEAIKRLGGSVTYDYQVTAEGYKADPPTNPAPVWLMNLLGMDCFATPVVVDLHDSRFTDADWQHLQSLGDVTSLDLSGTQVTDAGLSHLREFTKLKGLLLLDTQITDAGLVHLRELCDLERLDLSGTKVTDAGLLQVGKLSQLLVLFLESTPTTDAGLVHLYRLKNLRHLALSDAVTDQGRAALKEKLPQVDTFDFQIPNLPGGSQP